MLFEMTADVHARMHEFFGKRIGKHLLRSEQRESFAIYAQGIVADGERKSVEPIAARTTGDPLKCKPMHERLLHFIGRSPWSDRPVRREAAWYTIEALQEQEPVSTWIIDDTGFLKQGAHSVGVQRPVHRLRWQDHQLPDRRQPQHRYAERARSDRLRVVPPQVVDRGCRSSSGGAHPRRRGVQDQARSRDRAHYWRRRRQNSWRSRARRLLLRRLVRPSE